MAGQSYVRRGYRMRIEYRRSPWMKSAFSFLLWLALSSIVPNGVLDFDTASNRLEGEVLEMRISIGDGFFVLWDFGVPDGVLGLFDATRSMREREEVQRRHSARDLGLEFGASLQFALVRFRGSLVPGIRALLSTNSSRSLHSLCGFQSGTMLARGLGRRLPALARLAAPSHTSSAVLLDATPCAKEDRVSHGAAPLPGATPLTRSWHFFRGFASDALAGTASGTAAMPATVQALKNISNEITYDEHTHERVTPGDPSKKAFAYLVLTGGRFIYASALRILALKLILSMSASRDVLALAALEVDIASIEPGSTVTVKWRGKPVFVRHRTEADIKLANSTAMNELRDPEEDSARAQNPEWLVVVGVCTHLGCVPLPNAGDYGGWFCPCHGSHYDISGRIRKGPAPYNLEVPPYKFTDETKLLIG